MVSHPQHLHIRHNRITGIAQQVERVRSPPQIRWRSHASRAGDRLVQRAFKVVGIVGADRKVKLVGGLEGCACGVGVNVAVVVVPVKVGIDIRIVVGGGKFPVQGKGVSR